MTALAAVADIDTPARPSFTPFEVGLTPAPVAVPTESDSTVYCPACAQPALIEWRDIVASTSGPVVHVKVRCPQGRHWFLMLEDDL